MSPVQSSSTAALETDSEKQLESGGVSTLIHALQHISEKDHDRRLRRSKRRCQHWRKIITNLRLADDVDGLAEEEEELAKLVERFDKA